MKSMLFIVNPSAGQKRARRYLADIIALFNRDDYRVETYLTEGPGDAIQAVQALASGKDLVVCAGGDGTFNETVNGLLRADLRIPIGYIPCGSTNDFAATLQLPRNVLQAARRILSGTPTHLDAGAFGTRYFTYVASFGAFTRTSYATPQSFKNALGHTAYLLSGIQELSQIRPEHIRLEVDGRVIEDDFVFGSISNSTSVGGVLSLDFSQVDLGDGKFEIMLIRMPKSLLELSECLKAIQTQKFNCSMITFFSAQSVRIQADPEMNWTLDGEMEPGHSQVDIANLHHAITLIK